MARIQILNLPGEGHPFALVIDQINPTSTTVEMFREGDAARQLGARAVIMLEETIEIIEPGSELAPMASYVEWHSKIGAVPAASGDGNGVDWEAAATRNGELYSACENQRDDLRAAIARVRSLNATFPLNSYEGNQPEHYRRGYEHALRAVADELELRPETNKE